MKCHFLTSSPAQLQCHSLNSGPNKFQRSAEETQGRSENTAVDMSVFISGHGMERVCVCGSVPHLQQRHADEDPGHQRQVVLQPLLKLRNAALHVDGVLLLRVLWMRDGRLSVSLTGGWRGVGVGVGVVILLNKNSLV